MSKQLTTENFVIKYLSAHKQGLTMTQLADELGRKNQVSYFCQRRTNLNKDLKKNGYPELPKLATTKRGRKSTNIDRIGMIIERYIAENKPTNGKATKKPIVKVV